MTNWVGILSQGLRIAPPEAPVVSCGETTNETDRLLGGISVASVLLPQLAKTKNTCYLLLLFQTGYMFGKGVYFADMVTKSANYCYASKTNPVQFLMLCEVALGSM